MLNVRQAEQRSATKKTGARQVEPKDADTADMESRLSNALGLKVKVLDKGRKGGEVRILYKTLEQLDEISRRLSNGR
jgi:ParB family chromosome partitioning protein